MAEIRIEMGVRSHKDGQNLRKEGIRWSTEVGEISKKVQESRLKEYGHVIRTDKEYVVK